MFPCTSLERRIRIRSTHSVYSKSLQPRVCVLLQTLRCCRRYYIAMLPSIGGKQFNPLLKRFSAWSMKYILLNIRM